VHVNTAHWTTSRLLSTAARLNDHKTNMRLVNLGITQSGATTLKALADSGPISQTRLADLVHVQAQTMGKILDKLEMKGLVSKFRNVRDGRSNRTCITAEGKDLLTRIDRASAGFEASACLSSDPLRDELIRIITSLRPLIHDTAHPKPGRADRGLHP
jgi:DNA-binding MarR family transcriptional regulator